jgi:addiction module RelE/StbE family toxin
MAVVNWTHRSVNDLKNIAEFIEKDSVKYASLTIQRLINATHLLEDNPRIGRKVPEAGHKEKIREIIQGNYRIIYQIADEDLINILTVHHSSRKLTKTRVFKK